MALKTNSVNPWSSEIHKSQAFNSNSKEVAPFCILNLIFNLERIKVMEAFFSYSKTMNVGLGSNEER